MINEIHLGDNLELMRSWPGGFADCAVTSPPYWGLRDYGSSGQLGLERTPEEYVHKLVVVMREVRRLLKPSGTLWLNLGDCWANTGGHTKPGFNTARAGRRNVNGQMTLKGSIPSNLKAKDLVGIPWMVAFALRADGWYLRQGIVWNKPNTMPESVTDRCTNAHEFIFLLSKSSRYYFDRKAIQEPADPKNHRLASCSRRDGARQGHSDQGFMNGRFYTTRNKRSVWTVTTKPFAEAHFATYPLDLIEPCILAGSRRGGVVLDPFMGAGTTALAARLAGRRFIGCEINKRYIGIAKRRLERGR